MFKFLLHLGLQKFTFLHQVVSKQSLSLATNTCISDIMRKTYALSEAVIPIFLEFKIFNFISSYKLTLFLPLVPSYLYDF